MMSHFDTPLHKGRLNDAQKYENAIWALHPRNGSKPTAGELRAKKISQLYSDWSDANEGHTKESGKEAYKRISESN